MYSADGDGIAAEVHDELAVAIDADDIAFVAGKGAGEDAEADVVFGELDERVAEEGDTLGGLIHDGHEWGHDVVWNGGGEAGAAVVDQVILGKVLHEEEFQLLGRALQEDKAADGGDLLLYDALAGGVAFVTDGAVDEAIGLVVSFDVARGQLFLKCGGRHVPDVDIAPGEGGGNILGWLYGGGCIIGGRHIRRGFHGVRGGGSRLGRGHSSLSRGRCVFSSEDVDACW